MTLERCEIAIVEMLSSDLALRDLASQFMDTVESLNCQEVTIDFAEVESITRTFAHEYLSRKAKLHFMVQEINVPDNVLRMFNVIVNSENRIKPHEWQDARVIRI